MATFICSKPSHRIAVSLLAYSRAATAYLFLCNALMRLLSEYCLSEDTLNTTEVCTESSEENKSAGGAVRGQEEREKKA